MFGMIRAGLRHRSCILCVALALLLIAGLACIKKPNSQPAASATPDPNIQIEEILKRYQAAVGGQEAIDRIVSYQGKGTFSASLSNRTGTGTYEVWGKDPDKTLSIITFSPTIVIKKGFDGTTRWLQTPAGVVDEAQSEMAEVERDADIYRVGKIKSLYEKMILEPKARLHGRDVYVIEGRPARGPSDKLFFDEKDGLLLRWDMVRRNPKRGNVFVKVHLEDYRELDGVKVPFKIRFAFESFELTLKMDELKHNVAIDDSLFKKPGT
jgi:zinc protease